MTSKEIIRIANISRHAKLEQIKKNKRYWRWRFN
jgi:hypothetical protein